MATKHMRLLAIGDGENTHFLWNCLSCGRLVVEGVYDPTLEEGNRAVMDVDGEPILIEIGGHILQSGDVGLPNVEGIVVPLRTTSRPGLQAAREFCEQVESLAQGKPMPMVVVAINLLQVRERSFERTVSDEEGRELATRFGARYLDWDPALDWDASHGGSPPPGSLMHSIVSEIVAAQRQIDAHMQQAEEEEKMKRQGGGGDRARLRKKSRPVMSSPTRAGVEKPRSRSSRFTVFGSNRDAQRNTRHHRKGPLAKLGRMLCFWMRDEPELYKPLPTAPPRVDMSRDEWIRLYGSFPRLSPTKNAD